MPIAATEGDVGPTRPPTERLEPEPYVGEDKDGVSHVCFTPSQGKEVGHLFTDYHTIWAYMLSLEAEIQLKLCDQPEFIGGVMKFLKNSG